MKIDNVKEGLRAKVSRFAQDIAPVYKTLNWTWGEKEPPNQDEIEKCLYELIDSFGDRDSGCGTGGLYVFWDKEEGCYGIRFEYSDTRYYD